MQRSGVRSSFGPPPFNAQPLSVGRFHFRVPRHHAGCGADLHVPRGGDPAPGCRPVGLSFALCSLKAGANFFATAHVGGLWAQGLERVSPRVVARCACMGSPCAKHEAGATAPVYVSGTRCHARAAPSQCRPSGQDAAESVSAPLRAPCPPLQRSCGSPRAGAQPVPNTGWMGTSHDLWRSTLDVLLRLCEKPTS